MDVTNLKNMNVDELVALVNEHNHHYWVDNNPQISDQEYDQLILALKDKDPNNPVLKEFAEAVFGNPVKHDVPMLSMDKAYSLQEIIDWCKKTGDSKFMVSPKMDGTACDLHYSNGKLIRASTRGTGSVGEDITQNVLKIKNVPKTVSFKGEFHARGEVIMPLSVFNANYKDTNSNARNLASGSLKHKDPEESAKRGLAFYAYNVIGNSEIKSEHEKFQFLRDNKFRHVEIHFATTDTLEKIYNDFLEKRDKLDFEIDGVIFTANSVEIQEKMGSNSHHPRYSIAWKIQGESATTILEDIEWSLSRTGILTPVAILQPVNLSGAKIGRSSLHHAGFVVSKDLSKGAIVEVTRRGAVIPHVERVIKAGSEPFEIPEEFEGHKTYMNGDFLCIENPQDHAKVQIEKLIHFVSVIEADGFGSKTIVALHSLGHLKDLDSFYELTVPKLVSVDRMGEKNAKKLVEQIDGKRSLELNVFLRSLGIHELGKKVSKVLAKKYKTLDRVRSVTVDELSEIDGIGNTIADSVVSGLKESGPLIDNLIKYVSIEESKSPKSGVFTGKSFVFTGSLQKCARTEAQKTVNNLGGETPSSVGKDLTYLVCGENSESTSKRQKAEKLIDSGASIKIITEDEFLLMTSNTKNTKSQTDTKRKSIF